MEAFVKETKEGVIVVHLKGEVDLACTEPFHNTCMTRLAQKNIVFNLKELTFVGSDGLSPFLKTIKDLGKCSQLRFCCVGSEFRRMLASQKSIPDHDIFEDEQSATTSLSDSPTSIKKP